MYGGPEFLKSLKMPILATRRNSMGMEYALVSLPGDKTKVIHNGKEIIISKAIVSFVFDWDRWQRGTLIQNAFPYLSPSEREFLMTAITVEEWDKIFTEEET
jgi:hypothetical protein